MTTTLGTILAAAYALFLYRRIIFGALEKPSLAAIQDLSWREIAILVPLILLTLYYGVHPAPILNASQAVRQILYGLIVLALASLYARAARRD